jgi:hypothetical protein
LIQFSNSRANSRYTSAFPRRDAPEVEAIALELRGRGECRVPNAPAASCAKVESTRVVTTGPPEQPGIPARNGFNGFLRALPGDRAFFVTVACELLRRLDASVEASGPHDFAVRESAVRQWHHQRPPHPARVRDDRDTPLVGRDGGTSEVICVRREAKYFFKWDWTAQITLIRFNKSRF